MAPRNFSVDTSTRLMHAAMAFSVCFVTAVIGSWFTEPNLGWYATLLKPGFTPPNAAFPLIWMVVYAIMAIALFWIWGIKGKEADRQLAFRWFGAQLILNIAWSFGFFYLHSPTVGLLIVLLLLLVIMCTIVVFDRLSRGAALLLVPYLLWVCFAAGLNVGIWMLNG